MTFMKKPKKIPFVKSIFNYAFKDAAIPKKGNVKDRLQRLLFVSVLYKETEIQVLSCKFWKTLKNTVFTEHIKNS